MAPLTFFSANTHLSDSRLEKERLLSGNIQLYYHHLWMSSWDLGKSKLLKQIIACVCVWERPCVCADLSLALLAESQSGSRGVVGWKRGGDISIRAMSPSPCAPGAARRSDRRTCFPSETCAHTHTHTPSVLESHWQPLHKHKEAKLCHCQDQSLGGSVCAFEGLFSPGYGQSKKRVLNLSESV